MIRRTPTLIKSLGGIVIAVLVAAYAYLQDGISNTPPAATTGSTVEQAYLAEQSGVWMTVDAKVIRTLSDDNDGSRHQRFIIEPASGPTVLVAHNIDLAPRVPLRTGDRIELKGRYEWNAKGGVLHWTHHDPDRREPGGWIEHDGKRYQ